jgi:hypothetical protein
MLPRRDHSLQRRTGILVTARLAFLSVKYRDTFFPHLSDRACIFEDGTMLDIDAATWE